MIDYVKFIEGLISIYYQYLSAIQYQHKINTKQMSVIMEKDEKTKIFTIIDQILPDILPEFRQKNLRKYLSSKQLPNDYQYLKSNLQTMNLLNQQKRQKVFKKYQPVQHTKRKVAINEDIFYTTRSNKILGKKQITNIQTYYDISKYTQFKDMIYNKIDNLTNPMHKTIDFRMKKQDGENMKKTLQKYQRNKLFYEKLYSQRKMIPTYDIQQMFEKRKKILQENQKAINADLFCSNKRLFKSTSGFSTHSKESKQADYYDKLSILINYAKQQPIYKAGSTQTKFTGFSEKNLLQKNPFLSYNSKKLELKDTELVEKLISEKNIYEKVNKHQRNLNKDEKKLRKLISLSDYNGYK